jgi:hypothetical protein
LFTASGVIALDRDWQYPAITEEHAYRRMASAASCLSPGTFYVGYPWATLIDKLQTKSQDATAHLERFKQFCRLLPADVPKVTVCQHIFGRHYAYLFRDAGIRDVFWAHATHEDAAAHDEPPGGVRFHPFPLYPVQVPEALPEAAPEADDRERPYLFSFIGARANKYHLTEARNWILDLLGEDQRGLVVGRDNWHYHKVVYDLQVRGKASGDAVEDTSAAEQFRTSLRNTVFSLCPSGSGPNSIRLWESIGAGAIPVVLADTWAPPGDRRLWDMAAVFCPETPEAIRALPDRLAALAAEPGRLASMRHAMRQLWLLYGPQTFVTDVQAHLLGGAAQAAPDDPWDAKAPPPLPKGAQDTRGLLLTWSVRLLLEPGRALARLDGNPDLRAALDHARNLCADPDLGRHYDTVLSWAGRQRAPLAAPAVARGAGPLVALFGRHSHRTPLSYAPIRRLIGDRLAWTEDPGNADLIVTGFNIDWRENVDILGPLLARKSPPKLVIMSEEPLWDVTWSGPFTGRDGTLDVNTTRFRYTVLNHETSEIFAFRRLPYFVLTDDRFPVRYAAMMARFAGVTPDEMLRRWRNAPVPAAFFAEKRHGELYSGGFPDRDVTRLSAYRTDVAAAVDLPGVLRVGKGWQGAQRRQDLPDWHLDKLAQLDGRTRVAGAYENVHQRAYISEKVFDAFAVGAVPTYWAGPAHRVFDLVPAQAMLNTHGLEAGEAARAIMGFAPDAACAEAWLDTCRSLARLFGDHTAILEERQRVARAALAEIEALA